MELDYFFSKKDMDPKGLYTFIESIPKESLFKLTFGSVILFMILSRFINEYLFSLVVVVFLFVFFRDKELTELTDTNSDILSKYTDIQDTFKSINVNDRPNKLSEKQLNEVPMYLHYDPDMINLFHNILDFKEYNPIAYQKSVSSADHFLRLYSDILKGSVNCSENKEVADKYASDIMNNYHSFIFKLPSNRVINEKYERNKKRLHLLVRRKQDEMFNICKSKRKKEKINHTTKIDYNTGPKAVVSGTSFDTDPFDFFYL